MKMTNIEQVTEFLEIANACNGDVTLVSRYGDTFNLKSKLTQFVAVATLLGEHGDELELFCTDRADEAKFIGFLEKHPEI